MNNIIVFVLVTCSSSAFGLNNKDGSDWLWSCDVNTETCKRRSNHNSNELHVQLEPNGTLYSSLPICRLTCGKFGPLWPKPTISTVLGCNIVPLNPSRINFNILNTEDSTKSFLFENTNIFRNNILTECNQNCLRNSGTKVTIVLIAGSSDLTLNWETDESYCLDIVTMGCEVTVDISAATVFGVRHGLETLSQLIVSYPIYQNTQTGIVCNLVMISEAKIVDEPVYRHRGLLIDTSRNYLPISVIERQIDAMAATKLNVLHWHATDSQSFPLKLKEVPEMSIYGAYSLRKVYQLCDIRHLLAYAKLRGVRIILEIDGPAHVGNGWQWGTHFDLGNLAVCINQMPWRDYCLQPPCGQLNPINHYIYIVLERIYHDVVNTFPKGEAFHMGADEVYFPCWNATPEIVEYLEHHGKRRTIEDFLDLWGEYQNRALNAYDYAVGNSNTSIIVWSSALTEPKIISKYLSSERYIIEVWVPAEDKLPQKLLDLGYQLIMATLDAWYLDHGFWGKTIYHTWRNVYNNTIPQHEGILGGEVCMWGERVDANTIDAIVWPRASAAGERLWSDPEPDTESAEPRFYNHRERLVSRGIRAEALTPYWCYQNEGECI